MKSTEALFINSETIDCGSIEMVPVSVKISMQEALMFNLLLKHNPDIVDVFPTLKEASQSVEEASLIMSKFAFGYAACKRFSMFIKYKTIESSPTVGMIWIDSPDNPLGLNTYWTLDFFIVKELRNQGVMTVCVDNILKYSRSNGVSNVRAVVTDNNRASIQVLRKNGFRRNSSSSSPTVEVFDIQL